MIAERARAELRLDRVVFVPAYVPPHKRKKSSAPPKYRLQMTKLAVRGSEGFDVSDMEIRRKGISYTIDTLKQFRKRHPGARLFLILGSDNLAEFQSWKSYGGIIEHARLVVYPRKRRAKASQIGNRKVHILKGALLEVSSSAIRKKIREGGSIRYLVPAHVERYIRSRHLYQS